VIGAGTGEELTRRWTAFIRQDPREAPDAGEREPARQ